MQLTTISFVREPLISNITYKFDGAACNKKITNGRVPGTGNQKKLQPCAAFCT